MKDGKLTVAQIGCGAFAEGQDMPNFAKNPKTQVKYCCDLDTARAKKMAEEFNVPEVCGDFNIPINDPDVDLIKISTTHEIHLPIIRAAAEKGKHIFCEKPMAMEEEEAFKIISAVKNSDIKLCVDLNRRMAPSLHALKKSWRKHRENPKHQPWKYVECERDPLPEEKEAHFLVRIQDESSSYRMVHMDPMKGGGEIIGETVHWLDLACWLFAPAYPVEIHAWGSSRLSHGIHVKFTDYCRATILFNCTGTFDYPKELFEITSDSALFRNLFFVENEYYGVPGLERETFPMQRDSLEDIGKQGGFSGYMEKYLARVQGLVNSKEGHKTISVDKGHESMLDSFVEAILNDEPSPCDEYAGYLSTYLAKLAIKSIEEGHPLPVPVERVFPAIQ